MLRRVLPLLFLLHSQSDAPQFGSRLNVVVVPVVVRDAHGQPVGTLTKDDFKVFDNDKLQTLTGITLEKRDASTAAAAPNAAPGSVAGSAVAAAPGTPSRFIIFLFDDVHLAAEDLVRVKDASAKLVSESLTGSDAAGVFSVSGKTNSGITTDRSKLTQAIAGIQPLSIDQTVGRECPHMNDYQADLIVNQNDQRALAVAKEEVKKCTEARGPNEVENRVRAVASQIVSQADLNTRVTLGMIKFILQKLGTLPGQRTLVLVSPGFWARDAGPETSDVINAAAQSNVTLNTLDARGLYVNAPQADQSARGFTSPQMLEANINYSRDLASANADVMAELADGTGGTFFQDSNDLLAGFRKLTLPPEYLYLLQFAPQDTKNNGSLHRLKVKLDQQGLRVQSRRAYFAPKADKKAGA